MDQRSIPSPRLLVLALFLLSAPLYVLGSASTARLLPGLPLSALMFLLTATVALWAAWRAGGRIGASALLCRVFDARRANPLTWQLVAIFVMPAVLLVEYLLMLWIRQPLPTPDVGWQRVPLLFGLFFVAAACEELFWSATLLEPLEERLGALSAGLLIGTVWALWHVIPFAQANPSISWVLGQCLFTVGFRVLLVWVYDAAGRSLMAATLCHAAYNTAWQSFPNQGSGYDPWIAAVLTWLVVAVIVTSLGTRFTSAANERFERAG
ncbi:MAG TPA: CPBP family intramembrane glutamic endopeptidase [Myxococcota bacterium]|nr:CPBP family intramembrane glutamic endopeptidase [Myxococcota bacterium]